MSDDTSTNRELLEFTHRNFFADAFKECIKNGCCPVPPALLERAQAYAAKFKARLDELPDEIADIDALPLLHAMYKSFWCGLNNELPSDFETNRSAFVRRMLKVAPLSSSLHGRATILLRARVA